MSSTTLKTAADTKLETVSVNDYVSYNNFEVLCVCNLHSGANQLKSRQCLLHSTLLKMIRVILRIGRLITIKKHVLPI